MSKLRALALLSAVAVTAGVAHAQDTTPQERAAVRAEVPWYERFTTSHGPTESMAGIGPSERVAQPAWSLSRRWGVTVDTTRAVPGQRPDRPAAVTDETAVGAFFQFTPSLRVGGEVSVRQADQQSEVNPEEPSAGVRLESAFRF